MPWCWHEGEEAAGFPVFRDGALLLCGDKLATNCCGYWTECENGYWHDYDGENPDWDDLACTPPLPLSWGIATNCLIPKLCSAPLMPEITLDFYWDSVNCEYEHVTHTQCKINYLYYGFGVATFSGYAHVRAYLDDVLAGEMDVSFASGENMSAAVDVGGVQLTDGSHKVRFVVGIMWPDGVYRGMSKTGWVYCHEITSSDYDINSPGSVFFYPHFIPPYSQYNQGTCSLYGETDSGSGWVFSVNVFLGPYDDLQTAIEIYDDYKNPIDDYAHNCVCDEYSCGSGPGQGLMQNGEDIGSGEDSFLLAGANGCDLPVTVELSSFSIIDGTPDTVGIESDERGLIVEWESGNFPDNYSFVVGPCEVVSWFGGHDFEFTYYGHSYAENSDSDCTEDIIAAFSLVPENQSEIP